MHPLPRRNTPCLSNAPLNLLARLDRYVDKPESDTGLRTNRTTITRHALKAFLDAKGF